MRFVFHLQGPNLVLSICNDPQNKCIIYLILFIANEIIAKYFPKENLQFVLVGKADEIRDKVKKYGDVTEKDIEEDGF